MNLTAQENPPAAIQARGLTKRYGAVRAVDGLDLDVAAGTVCSLLGPNGSGKTTTVRMLATLLRPDAGSARVNGYDVVRDGHRVRRSISLTGQFAALDPNLTAGENLRLVARLLGHGRREAARTTAQMVERFGAEEFIDRLVKELSGGQRRRIDLAAGLLDRPQLLVLDEPTTGLDPASRQVVWSTLRDLVAEGITLLLTTQYLEEADALADRVVLIDHGAEIAKGTPSELKALVGDQRVDVVAVDARGYEQLHRALCDEGIELTGRAEQRRLSVPAPREVADLNRVAQVVAASGMSVDEIALRRPTLDDAFIKLTGQPAATPTEEEVAA
jgi:daunorubicin resistance ABC transporter ATP-binding subunit